MRSKSIRQQPDYAFVVFVGSGFDVRDLGEATYREDANQQGVHDQMQVIDLVGVLEKCVDAGAVQIFDRAEVDGHRPAGARAGGFECVGERIDVAEVDLPCRGHQRPSVGAELGCQVEWCGHYVILAYR